MTASRGAGAKAPALPVLKAPAFTEGQLVRDLNKQRKARVVSIIRNHRVEFQCAFLHYGKHTKECARVDVIWYMYALTPDYRMARHSRDRRLYHEAERHLEDWNA